MSTHLTKILPTRFQCAAILFLTVVVMAIGNTKDLLEYYGLSSSTQVVKSSASSAISNGLSKLDGFSFTNTAVTFVIWAVIGLFCFSIIQSIIRVYQGIEQDEKLSSNRYIHPATFVRSLFWKHLIGDFLGLVFGVLLTVGVLFLFFTYLLPASLADTRMFLQGLTLTHIGYFLLGFAQLYVGLLVVCACLLLIVHRRRLLG